MKIRATVIQDAPVAFDLGASLEKALALLEGAAAQGAQLVVFPEAFLGGYPKGVDFGARVGSRSDEGRRLFQRYWAGALEVPGPETTILAEAAARLDLHLVMGAVEREGGTLYCTVLFFGPEGRLLGKHRKVMPTAMERLIWGCGDGSTLPVLDTPIGRLGAVICWENLMPLLRTAMYAQGIQLYCAPTVDARETWLPSMRHIAMEGRCFVLSACQYARRSDYPSDYDPVQGHQPDICKGGPPATSGRSASPLWFPHVASGPSPDTTSDTVLIGGGSCIVDPRGQVLAGPHWEGPALVTADLDLDLIPMGKFDLDVVGHYARPDLFQLHVDTRAKAPVTFDSSPT